jgi:hypothetical protein
VFTTPALLYNALAKIVGFVAFVDIRLFKEKRCAIQATGLGFIG